MSAADTLRKVALAALTLGRSLFDPADSSPYELKQVSIPGTTAQPGGTVMGFRFTQVVEVNGERLEITVRRVG